MAAEPFPTGPHHLRAFSLLFPPFLCSSWRPAARELHWLLHHGLCSDRAGNLLLHPSASHGETLSPWWGRQWGRGTFVHHGRRTVSHQHPTIGCYQPSPPGSGQALPCSEGPLWDTGTVGMSPWVSRKASVSDTSGGNSSPILPIAAVTMQPLTAFFPQV